MCVSRTAFFSLSSALLVSLSNGLQLNLKEGTGSVQKGKVGTPDVTITVSDKVFLQLGEGR